MEIATPSLQPVQFLDKQISDSMSQDFHQNIFNFSNGFERSEQQQPHHVVHQIPRDNKLRTQILGAAAAPPVGMEEDGLTSYESGGIFSEMFNFSSAGAPTATELLESQISQSYRNPREAADWFLHRQDAAAEGGLENSKNQTSVMNDTGASYNHHQIPSINANSAAAMQLFLMNPQHQRSPSPSPSSSSHPPPASSSLHLLLPNHPSSFHTAGGAFGQFTWPPNTGSENNPNQILEGQGLSLSLSSSLEAAKAEELRLGLLFGQGGGTAPPQYHHQLKNFGGGGGGGGVSHNRQLQVAMGPSFSGVNMLSNSKYVKAAQELLEEFCSVGRGHLKKNKLGKHNDNKHSSGGAAAAGGGDSSKDVPPLSASERLEHQRRKVKLSSMLDEIDRRYNHYCERMQMVVNSFDMIMGFGAATPYTSLAQKAMSRHFRCLREAISDQLKHSCEQLGEKDSSKSGLTKGETPRLKFLEQSLRQQRAFHQMGMMEQEAWRPQRGLPQRSLTILRAWLFEHFLHPYPSDADKHLLARQTGLSRNQVANWFINARVRLWKPMVEEMYLQEAKEDESEEQNRDQTTAAAAAQTPTTTTALTNPAKINVHENDPSFISFNTSENHPHTNHVSPPLPTSTATMHEAEACRKVPANAGIESGMIRFGTSSGDVSLTLGLRHAGNLPEKKTSFSVRDFGSC